MIYEKVSFDKYAYLTPFLPHQGRKRDLDKRHS
jgi:hypothetical protein